jgi:RNA polymerase sigma-70 factor (ECF subfamily)
VSQGAHEPSRSGVADASAEPSTTEVDLALVEALRGGDEQAFATLVDTHQASLRRVARLYVRSSAVVEEVVQDTWLGVIQGLWAFEGRSSLKTWIFRILMNRAKTRAVREGRTVPFASLGSSDPDDMEPAVTPDRFLLADRLAEPGHRTRAPQDHEPSPERRLVAQETRDRLRAAIEVLPPNQRLVLCLRDVEGWSSDEVCNALGLRETNQRVLLHRARSKVRAALASYLEGG